MKRTILLSGIPGCGKSTFARWLAAERGFVHVDLEHDGLDRHGFREAWDQFVNRHDIEPLATAFVRSPVPVVLDWGYPPALWPRVAQLAAAGVELWWFEADRLAARAAFIARGDVPVWAFDNQFAAIAAAWNELAPLYAGRILRNLSAAGCFVPAAEAAASMIDSA